MVYDKLQPTPSTPSTSDNESHPMEKNFPDKINLSFESITISSIPDDGDSQFPKFNLYRIWNFQNGVIQNLQLYHTYTETICPIYIMSPLVVGEDEAFKTMALCKHNKVYNQTVLFIAFFYFHCHTQLLRPLSLYAYTHMVHTSASC